MEKSYEEIKALILEAGDPNNGGKVAKLSRRERDLSACLTNQEAIIRLQNDVSELKDDIKVIVGMLKDFEQRKQNRQFVPATDGSPATYRDG